MAAVSTGSSPYITSNADFEDITFGASAGVSGDQVSIGFQDTTKASAVIASLERARNIVAQYLDNLS